MSLSISGIGAVQPILPTPAPVPNYAQDPETTQSVAATTSGAESGAAAVVYEPGPSDAGEQYTYSGRPAPTPPVAVAQSGDAAVVQATDGAVQSPPPAETPHAAEVEALLHNVWAPVGPINPDPAAADVTAAAPQPVGQAEVSAQASYAAVADAQIAGASLSDLKKFA